MKVSLFITSLVDTVNTAGSSRGLEARHKRVKNKVDRYKSLAYPPASKFLKLTLERERNIGPLELCSHATPSAGQDLPIREQVKAT